MRIHVLLEINWNTVFDIDILLAEVSPQFNRYILLLYLRAMAADSTYIIAMAPFGTEVALEKI